MGLKPLEKRQGADTGLAALISVRNALQKPGTVYKPCEVSSHVEARVVAARSTAHERVGYYEATLGLLGGPIGVKFVKESFVLFHIVVSIPASSGTNAVLPQSGYLF